MNGVVPDFQFYDLSNNLITNNLFFKGRSLVIMHINTDCDLCRSEVKGLLKYIHEVEGVDIVWSTFDKKETLYDFLATKEGKDDHGENEEMDSIIDTFVMYDLEPVSGRLLPKV